LEGLRLSTGWLPLDLPAPPRRELRLEDVIDLDDGQEWWGPEEVERHYRMMSDRHRRRVDLLMASGTAFVGTAFRRVRRGGQRAEVRFDGLAGCLRTPRGGSGKQIVVAVDASRLRLRWMAPQEYARLQGAPDFPLTMPRNQLLFGFADAVCVPAIRWIDRHVLTPLFESTLPSRGVVTIPTTSTV
jgi:DNA (cytosine-5)-methyltransferase 1